MISLLGLLLFYEITKFYEIIVFFFKKRNFISQSKYGSQKGQIYSLEELRLSTYGMQ